MRTHAITLRRGRIVLRPMDEGDWTPLVTWNNDPEVLDLHRRRRRHRAITGRGAGDLSRRVAGRARVHDRVRRCAGWRVLVATHERAADRRAVPREGCASHRCLWGRGIGTCAIELLCGLAFDREGVDIVFGCDIDEDNVRSLGAFRRAGFTVDSARAAGRRPVDALATCEASTKNSTALRSFALGHLDPEPSFAGAHPWIPSATTAVAWPGERGACAGDGGAQPRW